MGVSFNCSKCLAILSDQFVDAVAVVVVVAVAAVDVDVDGCS